MVEAATSFKKSGYSDEDAATLALIASKYQNIADEALSAGDAADFIISQMKAFNIEAENSEHIIDAVNSVSNNMAVSSADLATNIGKASAALAVGGNTYEEVLALMTGITEITRSGTKAARALVSVQSRLNQVVDESSSVGQALLEFYEKHNIDVYDADGQLRSLYEILTDMAEIWPTLTKNEQAYYLNQQSGANQSQNLAAALSNFADVQKAYTLAVESSGSAVKENEAFMESLTAKTNNLKATFQDLANNVIDDELVGSLLDLANNALGALNTELGQTLVQIGLLSGVGWGVTSLLQVAKPLTVIKNQFAGIATAIKAVKTGTLTLSTALGAALPIALAVSAVIVGIYKIVKAIKKSIEENKLENLTIKFNQLNTEIESINDKLAECKEKLEKLNAVGVSERDAAWRAEQDELNGLIMHYEYLLELREKERKEAAEKMRTADVSGGVIVRYEDYSQMYGAMAQDDYNALTSEQSEALARKYETEAAAVYTLAGAFGVVTDKEVGSAEAVEDLRKQLGYLGVSVGTAKMSADEYNKTQADGVSLLVQQARHIGVFNDGQAKQAEAFIITNAARVEAIKLGEDQTEQEKRLVDAYDVLVAQLERNEIQTIKYSNEWKMLTAAETANKDAIAQVIAKEKIFNNMKLDTSGKIRALIELAKTAIAAGVAIGGIGDISNSDISRTISGLMQTGQVKTIEEARTKVLNNLLKSFGIDTSSGEDGTTTKRTPTSTTPAWVKEAEAAFDLLEHQRNMDLISEEEYYEKLNLLNEKYYAGKSDYLSTYWSNQEKYYKWQKEQEEAAAERQQEQIKAVLQSQVDALNEQQEKMVQLASAAQKQINDKLEELNGVVDDINSKYDAELEALEAQNDALDDQINKERLLQNLAKAQASMKYVFKDGHFQYVSDIDEVSSAQSDIADYEREKALERAKQDIEERRNLALKDVQDEISHYEQLSEIWSNYASQYEDNINLQIYLQEYGRDMEAMTFDERLATAQDFVSRYNAIMASLSSAQAALSGYSGGDTLESLSAEYYAARARGDAAGMESANRRANILRGLGDIVTATTAIEAARSGHIPGYANGTFSASGGLSLVGENGPELRVLGRGDGVLSSNVTRSLFRAAQSPGVFMRQVMGGGNTSINVSNITLPNVRDAQGFLDGLRNLAYQRAYAR